VNLIKQAKKSITISMYGFTDKRILNALIKAKKKGVNVQIILEHSPYKAKNENKKALRMLKKNKINVYKGNRHFAFTHEKSMVIDHTTSAIMTGNFTYSAFTHQRNFIFITTNKKVAEEIENQFKSDSRSTDFHPTLKELTWSPNNSREQITTFIDSTHTELDLYEQSISDRAISSLLAKEHDKKHVKIKLLVSTKAAKHNCRTLIYLAKHHVDIKVMLAPYLHAKALIKDHESALISSINLTTNSLDNNRELGITTDNKAVLAQLNKQFDQDWKHGKQFIHC
jgi:cardiolipin synthase